jgi:type VI secretion system VasI family protein
LLFSILGFTELAHAEMPPADCSSITDDKDRLHCYDLRASSETKDRKAKAAAVSNWKILEKMDDLTRHKSLRLELPSEEARVFAAYQPNTQSTLLLECMDKHISIIFAFDDLVANRKVTVDYRIGDSAPRHSIWDATQGSKGFGAWESKEAVQMAVEMAGADELFIKSDTRIFSSTEARYKTDGLREILNSHVEECGRILP